MTSNSSRAGSGASVGIQSTSFSHSLTRIHKHKHMFFLLHFAICVPRVTTHAM